LNVSPQIRTRGRKRAAGTPISAPNAKGSKYNHLSKVTTVSRVSNSPQSIRRCTRNTSKSTDNSFPESSVNCTKEKPKLTRSTRANKRDFNSDDSSNDSLPSDRKKARKTITSSIKIRDVDNEVPSNNAKKRLNKDVVKESISSKPTKKRNTKQQPVSEVKESPAPRVLRLRQKKQ